MVYMDTVPAKNIQTVAERIRQAVNTMVPDGYGFVIVLAKPKESDPGNFACFQISNLNADHSMKVLKMTIKHRDSGKFFEKELPHD